MIATGLAIGLATLGVAGLALAGPLKLELPSERDRWIQVETANFTLYANAPEATARRVGTSLEQLRAALGQLFDGVQLNAPLPTAIYVFKNDAAFLPYKLIYGGRPAEIAGYFSGTAQGNYVAIDGEYRRNREGNPTEIVYHEYLHHILNDNHAGLPIWFNEGLAELYSSFDVVQSEARIGLPLDRHVRWLRENPLIPLHELFRMDSDSRDYNEGERRGVFYAQSWALTHYLSIGNVERRQQTRAYADHLRNGMAIDDAFERAYGVDYAGLEKELKAYLRGLSFKYLRIPVEVDAEVEKRARVTPLRYPDVLYRLGDLLALTVPERREFAGDHFRAALELEPKHAPAIAGLGYLAEVDGGEQEARRHYARAAALAPTDARINYLYGTALSRSLPLTGGGSDDDVRERVRLARAALEQSVRSRPQFADAWAALGFTYTFEDAPSPTGILALERAAKLAPTRTDVVFNLLVLQARLGKREQVVELIERLRQLGADPERVERAGEALLDLDMRRAHGLSESGEFPAALALLAEIQAQTADPARLSWIASQVEVVRQNRAVDRYNRAIELGEAEEYAAAIAELEAILAESPEEYLEKLVGELLGRMKRRLRAAERGRAR